jgi:apolipoprotein N-acyltransferase
MPETLEEISVSTQGPQPPEKTLLLHGEHPRSLPLWGMAFLMASLSGMAMSACFWPLNLHFLAWIALVPWLVILPRITPLSAWLFGTILGLVFYRISLNWIYVLYGPIGLAVVLVLAILMGFSFRVARLMMKRFHLLSIIWVVPFAFVGQEILRSEGLPQYRFAFLAWGYTQSHNSWIAQIASLGGIYFISFLLISFNAAIAYALLRRRLVALVPVSVMGGIILCLGVFSQPPDYRSTPKISVACVQNENFNIKDYAGLTAKAFESPLKPRFVVLPEHTVILCPFDLSALTGVSKKYKGYICVGAEGKPPKNSKCSFDNMGVLIGPTGKILLQQNKAVPVPFMRD